MEKLLIVGSGSIGRRHLVSFRAAGVGHIAVADPNEERLAQAARLGADRLYASYEEALAKEGVDAVAVCVPPHLHVPVCRAAADAGSHLFVEKPLAASMDQVDKLIELCRRRSLIGFVAYSYRFLPSVVDMKAVLDARKVGRVLSARISFSSYLPDWHPWEDYRAFYMARKEEGGGALLDESHGLDLLRWLLGEMHVVHATVDRVSALEITSDDIAALVLRTDRGAVVEAHFDLLGRSPRIGVEIIGEAGTIVWDRIEHTLRVYDAAERRWESRTYTEADYLSMYTREVEHFLRCVETGAPPLIDLADGKKTLGLVLDAFELAAAGRIVGV